MRRPWTNADTSSTNADAGTTDTDTYTTDADANTGTADADTNTDTGTTDTNSDAGTTGSVHTYADDHGNASWRKCPVHVDHIGAWNGDGRSCKFGLRAAELFAGECDERSGEHTGIPGRDVQSGDGNVHEA